MQSAVEKSALDELIVVLLDVAGPIFFVFVIAHFILAIQSQPFLKLQRENAGKPGIPQVCWPGYFTSTVFKYWLPLRSTVLKY
jgi:hypothetical protein